MSEPEKYSKVSTKNVFDCGKIEMLIVILAYNNDYFLTTAVEIVF